MKIQFQTQLSNRLSRFTSQSDFTFLRAYYLAKLKLQSIVLCAKQFSAHKYLKSQISLSDSQHAHESSKINNFDSIFRFFLLMLFNLLAKKKFFFFIRGTQKFMELADATSSCCCRPLNFDWNSFC